MLRLAGVWFLMWLTACGSTVNPTTEAIGGSGGRSDSGGSGSTTLAGHGGGGVTGGIQEDVGSSPDRWTGSICPASRDPGVLTLSFADGSCLPFTYDASTFYNGAFLVSSKEGLRLDVEMLPDHSAVQSLALHPGGDGKIAKTSYCYIYGFKSLCQGITVSGDVSRDLTFSNVIIKSKFDGAPEILVNGSLTVQDTGQTNTFIPKRDACGPATAVGQYGGCAKDVLPDFSLKAGLVRDSDASECEVTLEDGTLTFRNGSRVITAAFDGSGEDQLQIKVNSQIWYSYRLDAGERLASTGNQLGAQVALNIINDSIDTVFANYREKSGAAFEMYTCRAQTPEQPWNHQWP